MSFESNRSCSSCGDSGESFAISISLSDVIYNFIENIFSVHTFAFAVFLTIYLSV